MTSLSIAPTKSTPAIDFDPARHRLRIAGESYPENCSRFYAPVFDWLRGYLPSVDGQHVQLDIEVVYFNSSSSKTFMDLFDLFDDAAKSGKRVTVNWRYHADNETALECGEEFGEDVSHLSFNLVRI